MRPNSNRILIVDDSEAIHRDIIKILSSPRSQAKTQDLHQIEMELFDGDEKFRPPKNLETVSYRIDSAFQGKDAIRMVDQAASEGNPYALVFMDVRMPPGIDGIETIERIWTNHPTIEMVIVTAFSDHSWEDILERVGTTDRLMVLRKPFDLITIKQLALALTKKYNISVKVENYLEHMELEVRNGEVNRVPSMVSELKRIMHT
ncbi:MAG: response regulator [Acidobacteriota bacterium]|nr:response regulator [Acidobacteriota bacterium]